MPNKVHHMSFSEGWNTLTHTHMSVLKLFFFYALPFSLIPPVMLHYVGATYGGRFMATMAEPQLQALAISLFVVEVVMTFLVAFVIQHLGSVIDITPAFEDCYKLAVVVATPLWIAPLFLYIPSLILNLAAIPAAMVLSGMLLFYSVPSILNVEEKGHAILLSGSILAAGMVAGAAMMYLILLNWAWVTSSLPLTL